MRRQRARALPLSRCRLFASTHSGSGFFRRVVYDAMKLVGVVVGFGRTSNVCAKPPGVLASCNRKLPLRRMDFALRAHFIFQTVHTPVVWHIRERTFECSESSVVQKLLWDNTHIIF